MWGKHLVLASQSPRRQEILTDAGIPFVVRLPAVEEVRGLDEAPHLYVLRLAQEKARAVPIEENEVVLGADTVVVLDDHVLEKPRDAGDATRMLSLLAGRDHRVMTGICLRTASAVISDISVTRVRFGPLTSVQIAAYIDTGEPFGKAGAYAIQGLGSKFIAGIEGCYFNVVGLPISLVYNHLLKFPGPWSTLNPY